MDIIKQITTKHTTRGSLLVSETAEKTGLLLQCRSFFRGVKISCSWICTISYPHSRMSKGKTIVNCESRYAEGCPKWHFQRDLKNFWGLVYQIFRIL